MMRWPELIALFESCSLRERTLISLTVLCAIWGLWFITVDTVVEETRVEVTSNITQLANQLKDGTAAQQRAIRAWPERLNLQQEKVGAELALDEVSEQIEDILARAMDVHEVSALLHTLLARYPGIELVELKNLPAEEVQIDGQASGLYRHPLMLVINGGYAQVVAYVEALEQLPAGVSFRRMEYTVEAYPRANVVLEIESLSRQRAWVGA
ncbi:MAG: hypothetical protein RJQ07_07455 [Pseudomonadales bacterium]